MQTDPHREAQRDRRQDDRGRPGWWKRNRRKEERRADPLGAADPGSRPEPLGYEIWLLISALLLVAFYVVLMVG